MARTPADRDNSKDAIGSYQAETRDARNSIIAEFSGSLRLPNAEHVNRSEALCIGIE